MTRQLLAAILAGFLASPTSAGVPSLGFIFSAQRAMIDGTQAAAGTTIFDGDSIEVGQGGALFAMLAGGGRIVFSQSAQARLSRDGRRVVVRLVSGAAAMGATAGAPVEGAFADLTFRPETTGGSPAGWIGLNKAGHIEVYAEKGDWLAVTGHDGRSILVRQGEHLEGLVADSASASGARDTNTSQGPRKRHRRKLAVWLIAGSLVAGSTGLALAFGQSECTLTGASLNPLPSCTQLVFASPATP